MISFKKHALNLFGKKIKEKFLVIESDDWGSVRIPDNESKEYLIKEQLISESDPFSRFECLESSEDFERLFSLLSDFKDGQGNSTVITANTVMANPDFNRIRGSDYQNYFYEVFSDSYKQYNNDEDTFQSFKYGIDQGYLYPQFHAREHLNVSRWMEKLRSGDERFLKAFSVGCFAIDDLDESNNRNNLMAAYDYKSEQEFKFIRESIRDGLKIFEDIFGFPSRTCIPPCYVWDDNIEEELLKHQICGIQSSKFQQMNVPENGSLRRVFHYMGQKGKRDLHYTIRNVLFEPSLDPNINWVDKAMEGIGIAFLWGKPAVIGSHRINYVGGLDRENREKSLVMLHDLMGRILKKWPDVKFVHSEHLMKSYASS